ncbi:MAG: DUF4340 domain-containing protein [Planctomycetaceae bacterium]
MNQRTLRTLTFVVAAAICLGGAVATSVYNRPARLNDAALVGEEFFPDFQDATKATALRVAAYDKDAAKVNLFNVEFKDGLWRIPSHHNYPADGQDQLAKTAASVIGIKRGLYAGKTAEDQKRLGVLDPLDDKITGTEGRGSRITLSQGGKALVDLIVGKKVDETGNVYYVRKPDDNHVFRAELSGLKVSTKFADWIEPDLLQLDRNKLVQLVIDRYQVDEQRGSINQGEVSVLTKKPGDANAKWELEGLDAAKEKVKEATVNQMTFALDDLKIVGVREKPAGLVEILKGVEGAALNQIEQIQMQRAGFFLTRDSQLVSNEGEILAGADDGIRYNLRFGEVLSGTDAEIEVGSAAETSTDAAKTDGADKPAEGADKSAADADKPDDKKSDDAVKKNRYVFITATFDESLLGERPTAPAKPEPPSGVEPQPAAPGAAAEKPADGAAAADESEKDPLDKAAEEADGENADDALGDAKADSGDKPAEPPAATGDAAPAADKPAAEAATLPAATDAAAQPAASESQPAEQPATPPDPKKEYEAALKKYEADLADYEAKNKAFDTKIEDGQKRAKELNDRFAPWYYVISADLFTKLKVERSELVEPATPPATPAAGAGTTPPGLPITLPPPAGDTSTKPADETEPAAESKPQAPSDTNPAEPAAPDAKPEEKTPAEASEQAKGDAATEAKPDAAKSDK